MSIWLQNAGSGERHVMVNADTQRTPRRFNQSSPRSGHSAVTSTLITANSATAGTLVTRQGTSDGPLSSSMDAEAGEDR